MKLKNNIDQKGFNLIEVVLVSFLAAFLLLIIFKIISDYYKNYTLNQQILAMREDAAYAMDTIINGFYRQDSGKATFIEGIKGASGLTLNWIKDELTITNEQNIAITRYRAKRMMDNNYRIECEQCGVGVHTIIPRIEGSSSNLERYSKIELSFAVDSPEPTRFLVTVKIKLEKTIWNQTHDYELEETVIAMPK